MSHRCGMSITNSVGLLRLRMTTASLRSVCFNVASVVSRPLGGGGTMAWVPDLGRYPRFVQVMSHRCGMSITNSVGLLRLLMTTASLRSVCFDVASVVSHPLGGGGTMAWVPMQPRRLLNACGGVWRATQGCDRAALRRRGAAPDGVSLAIDCSWRMSKRGFLVRNGVHRVMLVACVKMWQCCQGKHLHRSAVLSRF